MHFNKFFTVASLIIVCMFSGCSNNKITSVDINKYETLQEFNPFENYKFLGEETILKDINYKNLDLNIEKPVLSEADVQAELNAFLESSQGYEKKYYGKVSSVSIVNIDFVGRVDGEVFPGGSTEGKGLTFTMGENYFQEGFEDNLIGVSVGDTVTTSIVFDNNFEEESLRGKTAIFDVTINYLCGDLMEPALTDEYISASSEFSSVEDITKYVETYLQSLIDEDWENNKMTYYSEQIFNQLYHNAIITSVNKEEVLDCYNQTILENKEYIDYYGYTEELFYKTFFESTKEETYYQIADESIKLVVNGFIIQEIARLENIEVLEEDYMKFVNDNFIYYEFDSAEALKNDIENFEGGKDAVFQQILINKIIEKILDYHNIKL